MLRRASIARVRAEKGLKGFPARGKVLAEKKYPRAENGLKDAG